MRKYGKKDLRFSRGSTRKAEKQGSGVIVNDRYIKYS